MSEVKLPVLFVAHGAPTLALDEEKGEQLRAWAETLPQPRAIVVVSAHWEKTPPTFGTTDHSELYYDFGGFSRDLYQLNWPAPGFSGEQLAAVRKALKSVGEIRLFEDRKLDHGAWVPLLKLYPDANIPTLQVSLPSQWSAKQLFEFGAQLGALRDQGFLILTSGSLVHNLRQVDFRDASEPPAWAVEFDNWCEQVMRDWDVDALLNYREEAPSLMIAQPTVEHFIPLIVAAGAAGLDGRPEVSFPITGFEFGSISRRCVEFR